jgi:hypothetical protein
VASHGHSDDVLRLRLQASVPVARKARAGAGNAGLVDSPPKRPGGLVLLPGAPLFAGAGGTGGERDLPSQCAAAAGAGAVL